MKPNPIALMKEDKIKLAVQMIEWVHKDLDKAAKNLDMLAAYSVSIELVLGIKVNNFLTKDANHLEWLKDLKAQYDAYIKSVDFL